MLVYRPKLLATAVAVAIASPMGFLASNAFSQSADPQNKVSPAIQNTAQNKPGAIVGVVINSETGKPVRAADIRVGIVAARTNSKGEFKLELPAGNYELTVEHPQFRTAMINALTVKPKQLTEIDDVQLQRMSDEEIANGVNTTIEEVIVTATYNPYSSIEAERMSTNVMDTIDFTQIARFDDSSVSAALSRVVGVSLEEGRYPVVRGMRSRYQSTYFNDATLPGTDPARRDLPLDIFPANIMKSLALQKSASADKPGWATAGHIDMATKDIPEEPFFKSSVSFTYWDGLEDDFIRAEGGSSDLWGFDDGTRDMPELLQESRTRVLEDHEKENAANEIFLPNINKGKGALNNAFSLAGGTGWELGSQKVGFIASGRFATNWQAINREEGEFACNESESGELDCSIGEFSDVQDHERVINFSGMLNANWQINDAHQFGLENLLLRQTTDEVQQGITAEDLTSSRINKNVTSLADVDIRGESISRRRAVNWIEEQLLSHRFFGEHNWNDIDLNWHVQQSVATFDRPNYSFYRYSRDNSVSGLDSPTLDFIGSTTNGFGWEEFETTVDGYKLDLSLPVLETTDWQVTAQLGAFQSDLQQDSHNVTLRAVAGRGANPAAPQIRDAIRVGGVTNIRVPSLIEKSKDNSHLNDNYVLNQINDAYYLKTDINWAEKILINIGARNEEMNIDIAQYEVTPKAATSILEESLLLPSISSTFFVGDEWQVRLGYSETISWPETFEVVPRQFLNRETNEIFTGNPNLRNANITNYDARLEWYPEENESISLAFFVKTLEDAIESTFMGTRNDNNESSLLTFNNSPSEAKVTGWELDLRQEFTLGKLDSHSLFVQLNYTDITSEVDRAPDSFFIEGGDNVTSSFQVGESFRELQGQPKNIANLQLGYDHFDSGQQITLAFNRRGEQLARVGLSSLVNNDIYEKEYDDLRLIYKKSFESGLYSALSINNLLDSERSLVNEQEVVYRRWKVGRSIKLKFGYDF